jgi:ATP-dependent DNA helicase RecQ
MEHAMTSNDLRQRINAAFTSFQTNSVKELRPEQMRVINRIVGGGRALALFPTGAGKSLCYQVSGRALGGTTIVISPLIALMDEQADKLSRLGRKACALHAQIPSDQQIGLLRRWYSNEIDIEYLFLSPERLAMNVLVQQTLRRKASSIHLIAIDEAHCISEWGDDFRPLYTMIPATLDGIFGDRSRWPSILAMTATIGAKDLEVIQTDFGITHCERHADLLRENIHLEVRRYTNEKEKIAALWSCLAETGDERTVAFHYKISRRNQQGFSGVLKLR